VALSLPHHTVSATWHNVRLTRDNFNFFKRNYKKKLKIKKKLKKIKKKSKHPHADTWHIISTVTGQLTERNQLQRIFENKDSIESNKNEGTYLRFRYKNGDLWNDLTYI